MAYNWKTGDVNDPKIRDNAQVNKSGEVNEYGLHNREGVHTSELGINAIGPNGARLQPESYYSDIFLERKRFKGEDLVYAKYAMTRDIPRGHTTMNIRGYQPLRAHTIPLTEGNPPAPDKASGKAILLRTRAYGRYMEFTDVFSLKVNDPVQTEYTMELSDVASETIDMLAQAALLAEAQIFFPQVSKATKISDLILKAVGNEAAKASVKPTFDDLRIMALTQDVAKIGMINGNRVLLVSPSVFFDLQTDKTVKNFMDYGQTNKPMSSNELPVIYGIKVLKGLLSKTKVIKNTAGANANEKAKSATVHYSLMLGSKAYTKAEISGGGGTQFFSKELGSAGTMDPLNQRTTIGWKIMSLGFKVTDPDAVIKYLTVPTQSMINTGQFDYAQDDKLENSGVTKDMIDQLMKEDKTIGADGAVKSSLTGLSKASTIEQTDAATGLDEKTVGQFATMEDKTKATGGENPAKAKDKSVIKEKA